MEIPEKAIEIFNEWLLLENETAQKAGALGFISSALVQSVFPYRAVKDIQINKQYGTHSLTLTSVSAGISLPFGVLPRLLVTWISTEAVRTQSSQLILGKSLSQFMSKLGIVPTGGRWGSITRLRDQMKRLAAVAISYKYDDGDHFRLKNSFVIDDAYICWDPHQINQAQLWESTLILDDRFYADLITHPVPVDLRAIKLLQSSPMRLDIYTWITYRMSYLKRPITIPWEALWLQFGGGYNRERRFREIFRKHCQEVLGVYPIKIRETKTGLEIKPTPPHVKNPLTTSL